MIFTEEQLVARRKGIGGSEAASVFGFGYLSALELYFRKRGDIDDSAEASEAMFWGSTLEEPIANVWAERKGVKIRRQPMMRLSKEYPWMFTSVDRQILGDVRGTGLLEVKNFSEWRAAEMREDDIETVPLFVRIQVLHGLAVTGWSWGQIAILVGGNRLLSWEMEREQGAIDTLVDAEHTFMDNVLKGVPPKPDVRAAEILGAVYEKAGGEAITVADERVLQIGRDFARFTALRKQYEDEEELRKNALKLYLGNAEECTMPGVGVLTWRRSKDKPAKRFNEERLKAERPEVYAEFTEKYTKLGHRTFRMKLNGEVEE